MSEEGRLLTGGASRMYFLGACVTALVSANTFRSWRRPRAATPAMGRRRRAADRRILAKDGCLRWLGYATIQAPCRSGEIRTTKGYSWDGANLYTHSQKRRHGRITMEHVLFSPLSRKGLPGRANAIIAAKIWQVGSMQASRMTPSQQGRCVISAFSDSHSGLRYAWHIDRRERRCGERREIKIGSMQDASRKDEADIH